MRLLIIFFILLGAFTTASCSTPSQTKHDGQNKQEIEYYTCPMHHQIHMDEPGTCPICGMDLVPVYKDDRSSSPIQTGNDEIMISPERQQLIGVKTVLVRKESVAKKIRTVGSVAFDPEIAVAIREYLELKKNMPELAKSSSRRLQILGLSENDIKNLENKTVNDYTLSNTPIVYATLFESDFSIVKPGTKALVSIPGNSQTVYEGTVLSIDNVLNEKTRQAKARIQINSLNLKPSTFVDITLEVDSGEQLVVPRTAVLDSGSKKIVFVVRDKINFFPREIKTGALMDNNKQIVTEGLNEGDEIVDQATFLVDSEAQLKGISHD